jgi:hypothetical protein
MRCFSRRSPSVLVVLVAAAIGVVVAAALTSWWVLLALVPLSMMAVCVPVMAARSRSACEPGAPRFGCCGAAAPPAANSQSGRAGAEGAPVS